MRILSNFHDYYDSVQHGYAADDVVYIRKEREEVYEGQLKPFVGTYDRLLWGQDAVYSLKMKVVGFCGQIYPAYHITGTGMDEHFYSLDKVRLWVESVANNRQLDEWYGRIKSWGRYTGQILPMKYDFLSKKDQEFKGLQLSEDLFVKNRAPIFIVEQPHYNKDAVIRYNPSLQQVKFYTLFDVATTFQEVQMFINNLASPEKPIPKIDDLTMSQAKGFNKYSFRKDKSK